jgi:uncharacterized cupredoxin-like copper-binding protein
MNPVAKVAAAAFALVAVLAAGQALGRASATDPVSADGVLGPGEVSVTLTIHHSRFSADELKVRPGTTVRFVVDNQDPINHELIVGDQNVQLRHELGTEPAHPPRPGEVSVPPLTVATTTFTFRGGPTITYACHLPGHFAYGMHGLVTVVR